jgi:hypothetical protein
MGTRPMGSCRVVVIAGAGVLVLRAQTSVAHMRHRR